MPYGVEDVCDHYAYVEAVEAKSDWRMYRETDAGVLAPLIVTVREGYWTDVARERRNYYFWFFGYVAKLPYEREAPWPENEPFDLYFGDIDGSGRAT